MKQKDDNIQLLASKLIQTLHIIDSSKTYEEIGYDLEKLSEIVQAKVQSLKSKSIKEKKMNRSFQSTMLKELDNLNKALIDKK